ncbi:ABC transporter ATP-binding protein/permease [Slackia exigua]|uniref:ABC transporter ATP-binding protein n=1 Tax=Slackia exigua TaxID=84109 RepID=UPI003B9E8C2A
MSFVDAATAPILRIVEKAYALSERGARVFMRGVLWTAAAAFANLLPVMILFIAALDIASPLAGVGLIFAPWEHLLAAIAAVAALGITQSRKHQAVYCDTYEESSHRRIEIAETLRKLPLSFFGRRNLGDLAAVIMDDAEFREHAMSHVIPQMWGTLLFAALASVALVACDWRLAVASLWVLPASAAVVVASRRSQDALRGKLVECRLAASDGILETIECAADIRACNRLEGVEEHLDRLFEEQERMQGRYEFAASVALTSARSVLQAGYATFLLAATVLLAAESLPWQVLLLFCLVVPRLYDPLADALSNMLEVFAADTSNARLSEIERHPVAQGASDFSPNGYDIVFDDVSFCYDQGNPVLQGVSFVARQGEVTALVGPSGSGKSTIAALAARLRDPDEGRICLGGVDISGVDPEVLLGSYAEVFQDVMLFDGTISENIRLGNRNATDAEVEAAAKAARCDDFASGLAQGLDSDIAENGALLSGGQRQRISIARALLKDAPVVLLDEATSSLDPESETCVQEAIARLTRDKTVLVVAHRMRTVLGADHVVVLDEGRVLEEGTPGELVERGGLFARLCELQGVAAPSGRKRR